MWRLIETAFQDGQMTPWETAPRVLLYVPPYGAGSGNWNGTRWHCHFCLNKDAQPTHWQPLPEPPK